MYYFSAQVAYQSLTKVPETELVGLTGRITLIPDSAYSYLTNVNR